MKIPEIVTHEEKVSHCEGFPLRAVLTFEGCKIVTGKLFGECSLTWKSCSIQYFADGAVMDSGAILACTKCPGCSSALPMGPRGKV